MDEKLQEEMKEKLEEKGVQINEVDKQSLLTLRLLLYGIRRRNQRYCESAGRRGIGKIIQLT